MSYCVNPACKAPARVSEDATSCPSCHTVLVLQERYRPLRLLGQGGFGRTFLAVDQSQPDKPRCVVKQLFPQQMNERRRASELFRQEAQRLRCLEAHAQIPDLIDYFEVDDQQYLVQEFIDGTDLAVVLKRGRACSPEAVVALLRSLLPVLQFMHERRVIHRDIKPANIIRRDRDQKLFLVDLGAAKVATGTALARTGTTIGSAEYTAPEQLRGKAVFASDIYSLGMTCLHLLTGVSPFNLYNVDEGRLAWQDYLQAPIDQRLSRILARMTAIGIKQRYTSAKDVALDLQALSGVGNPKLQVGPSKASPSIKLENKPKDQPIIGLGMPKHPIAQPSLQPAPVKLQVGQQQTPLTIELEEERRTTLATPLSQKKPSLSDRPLTFGTALLSILTGELPLTEIGNWLREEASPDLRGDLAWAARRTVLTLLLMLGVPALLVAGFQGIGSNQRSIVSTRKPPSSREDMPRERSPENLTYLGDNSVFYNDSLGLFMADGISPGSITATSPIQEPEQGTAALLLEKELASIKTTGNKIQYFAVNESSNILVAITTNSNDLERSPSFLIEAWNLESKQKQFQLPAQEGFPTFSLSSDGETIFTQAWPPFSQFDWDNIPDIKAYSSRTGESKGVSSQFNNFVLHGAGPKLSTGETTIATSSMTSSQILIAGYETGDQLALPGKLPPGFFLSPQIYDSILAFGSSPQHGGDSGGRVLILDLKNQNEINISSSSFGYSGGSAAERTGDLKFDSNGKLYIGHKALSCDLTCLETYEFGNGLPSYQHIPAKIPPFDELFFTQSPSQVLLYISANLGAEPQLQLWNIETGSLIKRIYLGQSYGEPGSTPAPGTTAANLSPPVKLSADGKLLYTVHPGEIKVWDFQALLREE